MDSVRPWLDPNEVRRLAERNTSVIREQIRPFARPLTAMPDRLPN
jgi:hypothetical protein